MTNDTTRPDTEQHETNRRQMKDVSHTHPYNDRGAGPVFMRGPTVVADGGDRPTVVEAAEGDRKAAVRRVSEEEKKETMKDVDHTPPHDDEGANRVFARGGEDVREDEVVDEE